MLFILSKYRFTLLLILISLIGGCARRHGDFSADYFPTVDAPALSIAMQQPEIIVSVSPVRQTMQIGGSIPALVGAGISAIQDDRYGIQIRDALAGFDSNERFKQLLRDAVAAHLDRVPGQVQPFSTSAGFHTLRDARDARLEGLKKSGYDLLLDFDLSYGIYGPEGLLAARIVGHISDIDTGKVLWSNTITAYSLDLFADMKWRDPMQRITPSLLSPRFSSAEDAVTKWTKDGGAPLKASLEEVMHRAIAAVFTDLGFEDNFDGAYTLGVHAYLNKAYGEAEALLSRACALDPDHREASNALALAKAANNATDEALTIAQDLAAKNPEYLPSQYNIAWFYAVLLNDAQGARPYYEKAIALGASPSRRLKKAMN
ncbi:MAG: hypothetical protein WCX86_12210 [Candidatus Hydrogenedentales bacterium]